jgi:hypothetical protein
MARGRSIGMILLAIWLIITGLMALFAMPIPYANIILGLLALIAGILILIGR